MKYLNTKTQAVLETACVCAGGDWVLLEDQPKKKPTVKKATKKDVIKNEDVRDE